MTKAAQLQQREAMRYSRESSVYKNSQHSRPAANFTVNSRESDRHQSSDQQLSGTMKEFLDIESGI